MAYETTTLRSVLDGISSLLGAEPVTAGGPEHVSFVANIVRHLDRGWKYDFWPGWTPVELRGYRDAWNSLLSYAAGAEVLFGGKYWSASAPASPFDVPGELGLAITDEGGVAITDEADVPIADDSEGLWTELTEFARYIALEQPGQTPIAAVSRLCRRDPRVYPARPGEISFWLTSQGIVPDGRAEAQVWVEFRLRCPKFTAILWNAAKPYTAGAVVYDDASGDCYKALQTSTNKAVTDAAYWVRQDFPALLKSFVETACYADALRGDGQTGKALAEQSNAETFLLQAYDEAFAGQGQFPSASYQTR